VQRGQGISTNHVSAHKQREQGCWIKKIYRPKRRMFLSNKLGAFVGRHLYYTISSEFPGEDIPIISPGIQDLDGISIYQPVIYTFTNESLNYSESVTQWADGARIPVSFNLWNENGLKWDDWYVIVEYTDEAGNKEVLDSRGVLIVSRTVPPAQNSERNNEPTDITLSSLSFNENIGTGSIVALISTVDADKDDKHAYQLIDGPGSIDNYFFSINNPIDVEIAEMDIFGGAPIEIFGEISGVAGETEIKVPAELIINHSPDFETKSTYSVRLETTDSGGLTFEKSFTLSVNDLNELTPDTDSPVPQSLELSTTKVDLSNGDFTISATTLLTDDLSGIGDDNSLNAEIRWRSPSGQQFVDASFYAYSSGNDNDATFNNSYPITFNANAETGIWNIEYFRVVDEAGNGEWIYPDELKELGIETTIEVVNSANSFNAPADLNLTNLSFSENIFGGFVVASFIASDVDLGDYHDYKLVRGDGGADNSAFIVDGEQLKILASPDFETKSSYSIRVQVNDSAGLTFEKSFKLNVNDPAGIQIIQSMDDASTQDHVTTFEFQKPIVIHRQSIDFLIVGTIENDGLMGNSSSEILAGGQGKDILTGGIGADAFLFQKNDGFGGKKADIITDFYPKDGDFIFVEQEVFGLDEEIRLKSLSGKKKVKKAAKSIYDFIYHKKKGLLYFNENGKEKGWGDGGLFVRFQGAPELGIDDFKIV